MEEFKYFFSYARGDSEFVLKLASELRAVGANLWLDQLDILGGQRWDRAVEGALKACRGIIVILTSESLVSDNVMDEVSYALEEGKLVVPVLLRSCDIPFRLRRVQHIDFTADYATGFTQLLRALQIEQPSRRTEPDALEEPLARDAAASSSEETLDVNVVRKSAEEGQQSAAEFETGTRRERDSHPSSAPREPVGEPLTHAVAKKEEAVGKQHHGYRAPEQSFSKLLVLQILFGMGLFYLPIQSSRKWIYPILLAYSWIGFLNVHVRIIEPMEHFHNKTTLGAISIIAGWGVAYILGAIDFVGSFKRLKNRS